MKRPAEKPLAAPAGFGPVIGPAIPSQRDFAVTVTVIDGRPALSVVTVNEDGPGYVTRPLTAPCGHAGGA